MEENKNVNITENEKNEQTYDTSKEPNYQGILCDISLEQHKTLKKIQLIMLIQSAIITLLLLVLVIFVLSYATRINGILTNAEEAIANINELTAQLIEIIDNSKITDILHNANDLIVESGDSMTEALSGVEDILKKVNEIDFDSLNNAISDLNSIVSPLAKLFKSK